MIVARHDMDGGSLLLTLNTELVYVFPFLSTAKYLHTHPTTTDQLHQRRLFWGITNALIAATQVVCVYAVCVCVCEGGMEEAV